MAETVRLRTRARVQVVIEVSTDDVWGGDCTIAQVHRQAADSAIGRIRRQMPDRDVRIESTHVVATTVEEAQP